MKIENYITEQTKPNQFNGDNAFPDPLKSGIIYYCPEYNLSVHLCPCGCGDKVYLSCKPEHQSKEYWGFKDNSFTPSIQKLYGCKSHYFIKNGKVQWA